MNVEDWVSSPILRQPSVCFSVARDCGVLPRTLIECVVTCYDNGNYVRASAKGDTTQDAFVKALRQIEKTVGEAWRNLELLPVRPTAHLSIL